MKNIVKTLVLLLILFQSISCTAQADNVIKRITTPEPKISLNKILIIVDNKKQEQDFDVNSIDANTISKVEVIKNEKMTPYLKAYKIEEPIESVLVISTKKK